MNMKYFAFIFAAMLAVFVSCEKKGGDDDILDNPYMRLELTTKAREFVQQGQGFAFDFIDRINASADGNYFISPLSMQFLLGMLLDGAQGETATEISKVLGYGAGEVDAVNQYNLSLLQQLPNMDKQTKLNIANGIFVNKNYTLLDSYKSAVKQYYFAEVSNLNFSDKSGALKTINGWCSKQTNGMIPKVLEDIDGSALAVLMNAMYFKSQWKEKFSKGSTSNETFTNEAGGKVKVKMMKQEEKFPYIENDIYKAVSLPYGNGVYSMLVFLPNTGHKVSEITASLKGDGLDKARYIMANCIVDLWLPKFETKYHVGLNDILSAMGMPSVFAPGSANFKGMTSTDVFLSYVMQDAVIKVDEEGTEAAVVSTGYAFTDAVPPPPQHVVFHADHPFLYLIMENSSGAILFAGRYGGN